MSAVDFIAGATSGQRHVVAPEARAAGGSEDFPGGHVRFVAHADSAAGEHNPPAPAIEPPLPNRGALGLASTDLPDGQPTHAAQTAFAVGDRKQPAPAMAVAQPKERASVLANPFTDDYAPTLGVLADALDDIEKTRKATENRLRQLTRDKADKDGEIRGYGLTLASPPVARVAELLHAIQHNNAVLKEIGHGVDAIFLRDATGKKLSPACICMECTAVRNLEHAMRDHLLGDWVARNRGVGAKQAARLIAAIGDPYWNDLHNRPRLVSELWSFAGYRPGARRQKGQQANWSTVAKTRAYLVAAKCVQTLDSPWREVYLKRKEATTGRLHAIPCRPCGGKDGPAVDAGTPWRDSHRHADGIRFTAKQILKALWLESKRLHEST